MVGGGEGGAGERGTGYVSEGQGARARGGPATADVGRGGPGDNFFWREMLASAVRLGTYVADRPEADASCVGPAPRRWRGAAAGRGGGQCVPRGGLVPSAASTAPDRP